MVELRQTAHHLGQQLEQRQAGCVSFLCGPVQSPSTGGVGTHLASPQIRVTVPSSRSSTVTATSSELL